MIHTMFVKQEMEKKNIQKEEVLQRQHLKFLQTGIHGKRQS